MVEVIFSKNIEQQNVEEIRKYLDPFLWLVPGWCQELFVKLYDSNGDSAAIRTAIRYEYRFATMEFFSGWLTESDRSKGLHVVHDLLHISNSVYVDFAENKLGILCTHDEAPRFHDSLMEESRMHCESMTQDLAKAIYDRFKI